MLAVLGISCTLILSLQLKVLMIIAVFCLRLCSNIFGKNIASGLSYPWRSGLFILYLQWWDIHCTEGESGRGPGPKAAIDEHYVIQKEYVPTKRWPQWKAESRIELQLYCTSTQCHIQPLSIQRSSVILLFPLLVAVLSSFNVEKLTAVNSSFLFSFSL